MKSYGQFCPVAKAAELLCERWTPLIIRDLALGASRFSEIHRGVPLMSPTLLSQRLKQLVSEDVVERRPSGKGWSYHLTASGREFVPMIEALGVWGQRWSRRQLADNEMDLGLLVWGLERSVDGGAFGRRRTVIQLHLDDQPSGKHRWWFVNDGEACELCLKDPGFPIDLYVRAAMPDIIYLVRGDLSLAKAVADDRIEVIGTAALRRKLRQWLNLSPLAEVKSQRRVAVA